MHLKKQVSRLSNKVHEKEKYSSDVEGLRRHMHSLQQVHLLSIVLFLATPC